MKKTLSFLLAFLMIVTMVPVVAITSFASTEPTEIGSKEDFLKIGDAAGNYVLTQDIDLDGMVINTYAVLLKAGTTIDGAGHSIHNYSVKYDANNKYTPETNNIAMSLFALEKTANATYTIQNLTVGTAADAVDVDFAVWGSAASPLVAVVPAGTTLNVTNVTSHANFTNTNTNGAKSAGALVANTHGKLTVEGCETYGAVVCNVTTDNNPRGVGGILGWTNTSDEVVIKNSRNYATVTGLSRVGGIMGCREGGSATVASTSITISNCENHGSVTANSGVSGGVIGEIKGYLGSVTVNGFLNTGNVTGSSRGAAVVGLAEFKAATRLQTLDIDNVINLGSLSSKWNPGSMVGYTDVATLTIDGCISVGSTTATNANVDPMAALPSADKEFKTTASGTENYYAEIENGETYTNVLSATKKTVAELLEMLNANETITNAYGVFKYKTDAKNAIVQATPAIKGIQFGKVSGEGENATYSARLVATIQDTLYYENIGFKITVGEGDAKIHYSANVYGTIYGNENGLITYTAQELGGEYVYGLVINNIPADDAVTLTIRTYAKDKAVDGEGAAIEYFGAAQTITIRNGALVENAQ